MLFFNDYLAFTINCVTGNVEFKNFAYYENNFQGGFYRDGNLYMMGSNHVLHRIDLNDGAILEDIPLSFSEESGLDINNAIVRTPVLFNGKLYAILAYSWTPPLALVEIDLTTYQMTIVGNLGEFEYIDNLSVGPIVPNDSIGFSDNELIIAQPWTWNLGDGGAGISVNMHLLPSDYLSVGSIGDHVEIAMTSDPDRKDWENNNWVPCDIIGSSTDEYDRVLITFMIPESLREANLWQLMTRFRTKQNPEYFVMSFYD